MENSIFLKILARRHSDRPRVLNKRYRVLRQTFKYLSKDSILRRAKKKEKKKKKEKGKFSPFPIKTRVITKVKQAFSSVYQILRNRGKS